MPGRQGRPCRGPRPAGQKIEARLPISRLSGSCPAADIGTMRRWSPATPARYSAANQRDGRPATREAARREQDATALLVSPHSGGRISSAGGTGDSPERVARWWDGRRLITNARMIAPDPTTIPRDTTTAIITVSMKLAMRHACCLPQSIAEAPLRRKRDDCNGSA
jgi:hypothetical protein